MHIKLFLLCIFFLSVIGDKNFRVIDLGHELDSGTPFIPLQANENFKLKPLDAGYRFGFWYARNLITSIEQIGTHMLAPYSFSENGSRVNEIPVEDLFASAVVIDVSEKIPPSGNYEATIEDFTNWIRANGELPKKSIILIKTNWWKGRYPDQIAYYGSDSDITSLNFPGLSKRAAEFILEYEKTHDINIVGFGIDSPALNVGLTVNEKEEPPISVIASRNKYMVHNLKNLDKLPAIGATVMVMPMKIKDGTGSPTRVVARLPYK